MYCIDEKNGIRLISTMDRLAEYGKNLPLLTRQKIVDRYGENIIAPAEAIAQRDGHYFLRTDEAFHPQYIKSREALARA